jgi:hypothetical protein
VLYVTLPSSPHTSRNILKASVLVLFGFTINLMFISCSAFVINHDHGKWNKNYIRVNVLLDTTWIWRRLVWLAGGERFRSNWYVFTTAIVSLSGLGSQSCYSFVMPVYPSVFTERVGTQRNIHRELLLNQSTKVKFG